MNLLCINGCTTERPLTRDEPSETRRQSPLHGWPSVLWAKTCPCCTSPALQMPFLMLEERQVGNAGRGTTPPGFSLNASVLGDVCQLFCVVDTLKGKQLIHNNSKNDFPILFTEGIIYTLSKWYVCSIKIGQENECNYINKEVNIYRISMYFCKLAH